MDFDLKNYQIFRLKKYLKKNNLFFFFHVTKLDLVKWAEIEQSLKKLKLNYCKTLNSANIKVFKNSIYKNFNVGVAGFILLVDVDYKTDLYSLRPILKDLKSSFVLLGIKCNNQIYSIKQLKKIQKLSYKDNIFILNKTFEKYLKTSYALTTSK